MYFMQYIVDKMYDLIDRARGVLYLEDDVRVYPDDALVGGAGKKTPADLFMINNFLNHRKFYLFAAQFVKNKRVADIGCGSGYGVSILKEAGAAFISGSDLSRKALRYARSHYGNDGEFIRQGITELSAYRADFFDVCVCSEVLEHIKEYGKEREAVLEMLRITRPGGLLVIGTPNQEMLPDHGFRFDEIDSLFAGAAVKYRIYENALVPPPGPGRDAWEDRVKRGITGVILSEGINLDETVLLGIDNPELKKGAVAGSETLGEYSVDTSLLHNTHSWVVLAVKNS